MMALGSAPELFMDVLKLVSEKTGVSYQSITNSGTTTRARRARWMVCWITRQLYGWEYATVSAFVQISNHEFDTVPEKLAAHDDHLFLAQQIAVLIEAQTAIDRFSAAIKAADETRLQKSP